MSLQGLTVAISPSGIQYFANVLLTPAISTALQGLTAPSSNISVPDILLSSYKGTSSWAQNICIALSGGNLTNFSPTFQSLTQQSNGTFQLVMTASNVTVNYKWNEQYDNETCSFWCTNTGHQNNTYDYTVQIGTFTLTILFQFAFNSTTNSWALTLQSATPTTDNLTPNIPSGSIVNSEEYSGCFSTQVSASTKTAVSKIDFGTTISTLIGPLFKSIPASGQLTTDIAFQFPVGPSGLTFPGDAGIATGVTGTTTYKGTVYPGSGAPPQLALPPVPTSQHLNYYVSDYTFNSLFWAFFSQGSLKALVTPGSIPNPQYLNTSNYNNTPLQALYNAYPNTPMTANISALVAPTVSFAPIYDLSSLNLPNLQGVLPSDVYTALQGMGGQVYFTEPAFFAALATTLGQTSADQYKTVIESVALVNAAVVTHSNEVVLNVISGGNTIPVITFNVSQTDILQAFVLGVSGTTQTLQFFFQMVPGATTTQFISSTIPGIDGGDFGMIWNWVLQPVFATEVAQMGKAGVALPRITGFNFLFAHATVTVASGYVGVLADVQHVTDSSGVKYLMSKPTIRHGESIVPPSTEARLRAVGPLRVVRGPGEPAPEQVVATSVILDH